MKGLYKMHIFRPFSIQSLIPIVVLNFHPQPILQFLIDTLLRRPLSTESERPCATLIIECIETSTCESIPHLFLPFLSEWGDVQDIRNQGISFLPPQNLQKCPYDAGILDKLSSSGDKAAYMPFEVRH